MRKRIISMMLVICMVLMYVPTIAFAESSGVTDNGLKYTISDANEVTITGYSGSSTTVSIPNTIEDKTVKSIGVGAFRNCTSLTSVTIPNSVTSIEGNAFYNCKSLTSITIPNGVTSIERVFVGCTSLTSVTIPDSVTSIGEYEFSNCTSLTSIDIPNNVTSIGANAFSGCTGLTSITIPNSVTSIGANAFADCTSLASVTIPNSVTSIDSGAFENTHWLSSKQSTNPLVVVNGILINGIKASGAVSIPEDVTTIGNSAFSGCTSVTSVTIPSGVTTIGNSAFSGCKGLTRVTIPSGVTTIEYGAFSGCTDLTSVTIPSSVTTIGNSAFSGCTDLISITIPGSVTTIEEYVFYGCTDLTRVTIQGSVTTIRNSAFRDCTDLTRVTIPSSVTTIEDLAFCNCSGLTSITIPEGVTTIGIFAFRDCTGLKSITIPGNITTIRKGTFSGCTSLASIDIPSSVTTIGMEAFKGCTSLTNINIPEGVTTIDDEAFRDCTDLTSIAIPDSVTTIGEDAFSYCTGLTSITIPDSVTTIKYCTFLYCTSLRNIDIPSSVTYIDDGAFFGCTELGSIFLPDKENLSIHNKAIPNTASKVSYSLDETKSEVIITKIALGTDKNSVEIPATICGYPVVAVASDCQEYVGTHTCILDYIPKKAATYSADGNIEYWHCKVCGKYFSDKNGTHEISQQDTVIPKLIYYDPTESFTSPVSDGNAIEIKAQISDGTATVSEITTEAINKMLDNASSNGETKVDTITIDLSGAKQEVKAITLSKKTLETLVAAIASEDNDIETVTIVLSKASIVLDSKTLEAVVKEAKGNDIKLVINDKEQSKLNTLQRNAIKDYHVATLFEAIFESNGKEIHDFNGGTATVTIDFTPEESKNMDYYHMVHISDDGVMTRFKTRYTIGKLSFITPHFSDYAVIYDESEKNQTAIERPVPVTGLDVTVDKTTLTKKGATANIKATVQPDDATNKNVTYTSSNTKVATVDKKGKVTAVANGKTTVTVKTVDGSFTKKIVITVKIPDPMPTKAQIAANSVVLNSNATAKWTKENYLKLTWGKVAGAAGYEVYVNKCDGKTLWTKAAYTAKSGKTTSVTLKKLGGKKFSGAANYKYGVRAYKYVNGKKVYMGTTLTYHFVGSKNKKETNAKSVIAGKKAITLGVKKTTTLRTKLTKVNTSRRLVKHDTWIRYISSNPSVAKVDMRTGKVTGVKAGKCKIYCIALNGVKTTVSVTVK